MMMRRTTGPIRFLRLLPPAPAALLVAVLAAGATGHAAPPGAGAAAGLPRPTLDPRPPMTLTVEVVAVQKSAAGGVASLLLSVGADMGIEDAVVSARTPGNLVFADGSATRTWNVDLTTPGLRSIPVDVIVPQDGKYIVTAEVSGTARGKTVHRGTATRLLVGVREPAARVRGGAIEYQAAEAGEPTP